ncbi:MAG: hypothetical protein H7A42_01940 [Chlamydiales bacterium]|nr:hypothetical protein [Chlamydiales bacterium]
MKKIQPMLRKQGMEGALHESDKLTHRDLIVIEDMAKLAPSSVSLKKDSSFQRYTFRNPLT